MVVYSYASRWKNYTIPIAMVSYFCARINTVLKIGSLIIPYAIVVTKFAFSVTSHQSSQLIDAFWFDLNDYTQINFIMDLPLKCRTVSVLACRRLPNLLSLVV